MPSRFTYCTDLDRRSVSCAWHSAQAYSSACGRRDLRTEALVSSDESEDSDVGRSNARSEAGIMSSDEDSDAGSMVAQSSSSVKAKESLKPNGPPPDLDPMHFISSSKVLSYMSA